MSQLLARLREHAAAHPYSHTLDDCALYQAAMTGTMFPIPTTVETLTCTRCGNALLQHPEADVPDDWLQVTLPCSTVVFCGACIGEYGGSRSALKRQSDDLHRDRGGCVGCRA